MMVRFLFSGPGAGQPAARGSASGQFPAARRWAAWRARLRRGRPAAGRLPALFRQAAAAHARRRRPPRGSRTNSGRTAFSATASALTWRRCAPSWPRSPSHPGRSRLSSAANGCAPRRCRLRPAFIQRGAAAQPAALLRPHPPGTGSWPGRALPARVRSAVPGRSAQMDARIRGPGRARSPPPPRTGTPDPRRPPPRTGTPDPRCPPPGTGTTVPPHIPAPAAGKQSRGYRPSQSSGEPPETDGTSAAHLQGPQDQKGNAQNR